jgi:tetratricopeptide (TPR) repeat protein
MLREALDLHRAGRLGQASRLYHQILAVDPWHADSLHLLGMIAYQAGSGALAIKMIRKAIAINQRDAAYHSNLGTVLHAQGKLEEAAACYQAAVVLQPELAEAHYNLGNVFHAQERLEQAAACYRRALAIKSELTEAHYNLGNVLQAQEKMDEAIASYERALALDPSKYEALHNLGNVFQSQGKLEAAKECCEKVLILQPDYAKAWHSLGTIFHSLGNVDEALVRYRTALALQPDCGEAAFSESLAQLLRGEFRAGWRNYEWRWQTKDHVTPMRIYPQPLWNGDKLTKGRLLIWPEQGVGDEIMFAGLIPDVVRLNNSCLLECDPRLKPLFARSFPDLQVISSKPNGQEIVRSHEPGPEPDFSAHLPCGSLPRLFRKDRAAFAAPTASYLIADPVARKTFRDRYADGRRLVGLAWHTNNRKTGRSRSVELSSFTPLFALPDIRWISLQYGDYDALEKQAAAAAAPILIDRSVDQFANLDLFAAQIAAMDLVLTIDNSTAHLAGALGIPIFVLLPFAPDWRWLQTGEQCLWYPNMRLFRQSVRGDWNSEVQKINEAIGMNW